MIFDYIEVGDGFLALLVILVFGVIFYSWGTILVLLVLSIGIVPVIRHRNEHGIFLQWPYKQLGTSLPGLMNPKGEQRYSD